MQKCVYYFSVSKKQVYEYRVYYFMFEKIRTESKTTRPLQLRKLIIITEKYYNGVV